MKSPIQIAQPVNYEALATAYDSEQWKWYEESIAGYKIPDEKSVRETIEFLTFSVHGNPDHYIETGGIAAQIIGGQTIVLIDQNLHRVYDSEVNKLVSQP